MFLAADLIRRAHYLMDEGDDEGAWHMLLVAERALRHLPAMQRRRRAEDLISAHYRRAERLMPSEAEAAA